MKQKIVLILGLAISGVCLYWVFKDVDAEQIFSAFKSFDLLWLIPSLFFFYWSMYLRAARWAIFFRPHHQLNGRRLFRPNMIGYAFNSIMPARVGEIVRALYVGSHEKTGFPTALTTIVAERVCDGVTLLACLAISFMLLPPIDPTIQVQFWGFQLDGSMLGPYIQKLVIASAVLVAGVTAFMVPAVQRLAIAIVGRLPGPEELRAKLKGFIEGMARGLDAMRDIRNFAAIVCYSIAIWGLVILSNLVLAYGFPGLEMTFLQSTAILTITAVFIMIPAAPGYWGLFEAGIIFGLTVFGLNKDSSVSVAYAIIQHLVQYVPIVVIGLVFAAQAQVKVRPAHHETEERASAGAEK